MTKEIAAIAPKTGLGQSAQQILEHPGICLLVVEDDRLVGILTTLSLRQVAGLK